MTRMPVYFLSHGGGPWPYVEGMRQQFAKTEHEFMALPGRLPATPKAVLVIVHSNRGLSLKGCAFKSFKPPLSIC